MAAWCVLEEVLGERNAFDETVKSTWPAGLHTHVIAVYIIDICTFCNVDVFHFTLNFFSQ